MLPDVRDNMLALFAWVVLFAWFLVNKGKVGVVGWKVLVLFWLIRLRNGLVDTLSGEDNEEFFMFSFCKSFCKKALLVLVFGLFFWC